MLEMDKQLHQVGKEHQLLLAEMDKHQHQHQMEHMPKHHQIMDNLQALHQMDIRLQLILLVKVPKLLLVVMDRPKQILDQIKDLPPKIMLVKLSLKVNHQTMVLVHKLQAHHIMLTLILHPHHKLVILTLDSSIKTNVSQKPVYLTNYLELNLPH